MTKLDPTQLSAEDIRSIEVRAHMMRNKAMAEILRALATRTARSLQKLSALVRRPGHA